MPPIVWTVYPYAVVATVLVLSAFLWARRWPTHYRYTTPPAYGAERGMRDIIETAPRDDIGADAPTRSEFLYNALHERALIDNEWWDLDARLEDAVLWMNHNIRDLMLTVEEWLREGEGAGAPAREELRRWRIDTPTGGYPIVTPSALAVALLES